MANEQTLTGLELRKAALGMVGISVRKMDTDELYEKGLVVKPRPTPFYVVAYPDGIELLEAFGSEHGAWKHAPAVESSVDEALRWLTLDDERYWKLIGPNYGSYYVHIAEELESTWVSLAGSFDRQGFAPAMCRAYLAWKAGA